MKKMSFLLAAILVSTAAYVRADETIRIGWIGPLTGNAAVLGTDSAPALQMAADDVNAAGGIGGRRLEVVLEDDQYIPAKTVAAYQKLVNSKGIKILVVLSYSGLFALAPTAEKDGVILIDPLDCDENIGALPRNVICIAKRSEELGFALAESILKNKELPVGVIYYDADAFNEVVAKSLISRLGKEGTTPLFVLTYNDTTQDFRPLLLKAKEGKVKALALLGYDTLGVAMKQAREMGIKAQFYATGTLASKQGLAVAGTAAEGARGTIWQAKHDERHEEFKKAFIAKTGRDPLPDVFMLPAYDTGQVLARALREGGYDAASGRIDTGRILDFLYSMNPFPGLSGSFSIDEKGMVKGLTPPGLNQVKNGGLVPVQ